MSTLQIFLADDHVMIREGLRRLIESEPDLAVCGQAIDGREAVEQAKRLKPDVVVMDISMPELNGAEATRQIRQARPETKVLVLTVHEDKTYLRELLEAGAVGYLLKRAAADELVRAIRSVAAGGVYVDPRIAGKMISTLIEPRGGGGASMASLSEREGSVLRQIAFGYTNKEIAAQLGVSVKTVETYKARSMEKLGLRSRVDIVRAVTERGWFPSGS